MKLRNKSEGLLTKYLLGELGGNELDRFEERYFGDRELYEQLLVAEDELIDAYVHGRLAIVERDRFEQHFLRSPERRKRVEFATSLTMFVAKGSKPDAKPQERSRQPFLLRHSGRRWSWLLPLAAGLFLVVAGSWLLVDINRLRREAQQSKSEQSLLETRQRDLERQLREQQKRNTELLARLEKKPNQMRTGTQNPAKTLVLTLGPSVVRGSGELKTLEILSHIEWVRLEAGLRRPDYEKYRATLTTAAGVEIKNFDGLKVRRAGSRNVIVLTLRSESFRNDDYLLSLSGTNAAGDTDLINEYPFRIRKK